MRVSLMTALAAASSLYPATPETQDSQPISLAQTSADEDLANVSILFSEAAKSNVSAYDNDFKIDIGDFAAINAHAAVSREPTSLIDEGVLSEADAPSFFSQSELGRGELSALGAPLIPSAASQVIANAESNRPMEIRGTAGLGDAVQVPAAAEPFVPTTLVPNAADTVIVDKLIALKNAAAANHRTAYGAQSDQIAPTQTSAGANTSDTPISTGQTIACHTSAGATCGSPDPSEPARPTGDTELVSAPTASAISAAGLGEPDPRLTSPAARVQTLQQALARTYQTSPSIMGQRAELRGLDSRVALERAAGNPQITTLIQFDQEVYTTRVIGTRGRSLFATADVSKVLFAGGRIRNSVRAADTQVIAGRADLRATEGDVLTEAVAAYTNVIRDREIRDLNLSQVRVLEANLESTRSRFRVRDLTITDVAQSQARLEVARGNLATAEGRLQSSEEDFERVVGARAGILEPVPPLPQLPQNADQAVETALADNAQVAAFAARARAAGYEVSATRAARLPTISAVTSTTYNNALGTADTALGLLPGTSANSLTNIGAGILLRLPLYQGGAASARVRQAEETRDQRVEEAIAAERLAVANARAAFAIWRSAMTTITSNELAVAANKLALESIKIEQTVGARSILDVLNAEQELLSSQIALASARRDAYVSAFELLNTMGAAEGPDLNLEVGPLYDPRANYRAYAHTWSDWADGPRRAPSSTRTVTEEVDSPLTRLNTGRPNEAEKRP